MCNIFCVKLLLRLVQIKNNLASAAKISVPSFSEEKCGKFVNAIDNSPPLFCPFSVVLFGIGILLCYFIFFKEILTKMCQSDTI